MTSLIRSVIVHDAASCSREDYQNDYGRPYDTLSCLFFSAQWLQQGQSFLVQEFQSAKDIDLICFKTFPIKAATCLQIGPMSTCFQVGSMFLDWLVDPFSRFDQSRLSLSPEDPRVSQQRGALPASTRSSRRQDAFQAQPQKLPRTKGWNGCASFLSEGIRCILLGTPGVLLDLFSPDNGTESQTQIHQEAV